jgi:putative transposase
MRIIGAKLAVRGNRPAGMLGTNSAWRRIMALSVESATVGSLRHVVVQARGHRPLYLDPGARATAARRVAESCGRHRLHCLVWCITDRCMHVVVRGAAASITLATHEMIGARLRHGHWLSTGVKPDVYLLEVARHALLAPVRAGLCRRPGDWPFSSARESLGLRPVPGWLDPLPLYDLLGPRDGRGPERLRRFMDSR